MFGLKTLPAKKLTALKFVDEPTFRQAARLAAERKIPVEAPGYHTLIVRKSDRGLFKAKRLKFEEERIGDPEGVPGRELSALRRFARR
jgi:hypothetical protein